MRIMFPCTLYIHLLRMTGTVVAVIVWGCITHEGVGTLTVVDGNINAQKYIEVSDNFVWHVIAQMTIM